jgi:hypothetical protein
MASRDFKNVQSSERAVKIVYGRATIAGSGAPTLDASSSIGVKSITRTAAGDYTIVLGSSSPAATDKYSKLLWADATIVEADDTDLHVNLASDTVSTDGTFKIICATAATPTDPPSGAVLLFKAELKNTSVK